MYTEFEGMALYFKENRQSTTSSRKNWRILQLNRSEIGTTKALQCQALVWGDHTIDPRTAKNGDNYCAALKRNMGRSTHGNLVQFVNLQNRRRAGSSIVIIPPMVCLLLLQGAAVRRAPTILPIDRFCTSALQTPGERLSYVAPRENFGQIIFQNTILPWVPCLF